MKNILQKTLLSIVMAGAVLSFATVSAQQVSGSVCITSGGQQGIFNGSVCIGNGGPTTGGPTQAAYQANNANLGVIANLIKQIQNLVGMLLPLMVGVAVVWFAYNLIKYFLFSDAAEDKGKAMKNAGYGLAAIFLMVSIWGIIYFLNSATGINQGGQAQLPTIPTYQN